jgi:hypothetical protein
MKAALKALENVQLPQSQESTSKQLKILIVVANKLGLYDAADQLKGHYHNTDNKEKK